MKTVNLLALLGSFFILPHSTAQVLYLNGTLIQYSKTQKPGLETQCKEIKENLDKSHLNFQLCLAATSLKESPDAFGALAGKVASINFKTDPQTLKNSLTLRQRKSNDLCVAPHERTSTIEMYQFIPVELKLKDGTKQNAVLELDTESFKVTKVIGN